MTAGHCEANFFEQGKKQPLDGADAIVPNSGLTHLQGPKCKTVQPVCPCVHGKNGILFPPTKKLLS